MIRPARLQGLRHKRPGSRHELPEELPEGEHVLWQGAPATWAMARALHIRGVACYFAVLVAWYAADGFFRGNADLLLGLARVGGLALATIALFAAYAWLAASTSSYTFTNRRVVLQVGIALPISFNIPLGRIVSAGVAHASRGAGDIVLTLLAGDGLGYFAIWPHARPWRFAQAEPMLRALPEVDRVARILVPLLASAPAAAADEVAEPTRAPAEPARAGYGPVSAAA